MDKNLLSRKTLAEYEAKMTKLMEDFIRETENQWNRNSFFEEENSEFQNEVSSLQVLHTNPKADNDTVEMPDHLAASLGCQSLPESLLPALSGPSSIQSQSLSNVDFFSNDEEMQIDEETPNTESAGGFEGVDDRRISEHDVIIHNPDDQPKGVEKSKKSSWEDVLHSNIPESYFRASVQSESLSEANFFSNVEDVEGFYDEHTSQFDVTTYNPKDLLKIRAECHIDFMQLKNSRKVFLDSKSSKCVSSRTQINSSEMGKQLSPLLPGHFHDNTRPNTCLNENVHEIPKTLIREFIKRKKKRVAKDVKYALRSAPPQVLINLPSDFNFNKKMHVSKEKPGVKYGKTYDSLFTTVQLYDSFAMKLKKYIRNWSVRRTLKNLEEDNPIADVLNELKCSLSEDLFNKQAIPSVIKVLTNREIMPDKTYFSFYVFHYIYVLGCSCDSAINCFSLHPYEKIVLSSLFEVDEMKKRYLNNFMASAVESLHLLLVTKPWLRVEGIFALCKVFAEICRQKNLVQKPVSLAIDLLKDRNKHSTGMIASMISVWSKPFEVTEETSDEKKCLFAALAFGVFKSPNNQYYPRYYAEPLKLALKILEKHFCPIPDNKVLEEVIDFLIAKIHLECDRGTPLDVENFLIAPIIIFASRSEWNWTQDNILKKHVIPSLSKYEQEKNETAFGVFCDLYAEIFVYSSEKPYHSELMNYLKSEGNKFVKDFVAVSYLRLLVLQRKTIWVRVYRWLQENEMTSNVQNSKAESLLRCVKKVMVKNLEHMGFLAKEDF